MNRVFQRGRLVPLALALALLEVACGDSGPPAPATFPARGQVKYKNGRPVSGGTVEFRSLTNPSATTVGALDDDGKFTLHTLAGSRKIPGAQEGMHRVTIVPQALTKKIKPIVLPDTYQVKAGENLFEIRIEAVADAP